MSNVSEIRKILNILNESVQSDPDEARGKGTIAYKSSIKYMDNAGMSTVSTIEQKINGFTIRFLDNNVLKTNISLDDISDNKLPKDAIKNKYIEISLDVFMKTSPLEAISQDKEVTLSLASITHVGVNNTNMPLRGVNSELMFKENGELIKLPEPKYFKDRLKKFLQSSPALKVELNEQISKIFTYYGLEYSDVVENKLSRLMNQDNFITLPNGK